MRCSGSYPDNPLAYTAGDISSAAKIPSLAELLASYKLAEVGSEEEQGALKLVRKGVYDAIVNGIRVAFSRSIDAVNSAPEVVPPGVRDFRQSIVVAIARVRDE
jgi:hypothetical protein